MVSYFSPEANNTIAGLSNFDRPAKSKKRLSNFFYKAGWCLFVGLFEQEPLVNEDILEYCDPQYLQVYFVFSLPSYNECLFVGLLEQEPDVREETDEYFEPQYSQ